MGGYKMENKIMNKRVYGILGISSVMGNWNADFSGYPKSLSDGTIFASDKALKYPMKKMWDNESKKVIYIKSLNEKLLPKTLEERYIQVFGKDDFKSIEKVLSNLMTAVDIKNFGATFAQKECNIAITGAVQIGQGINRYNKSNVNVQSILSPFRDKTDKKAKNSTIGTKITSEEAHYFYPFVINPLAYKELVDLGVTEGYTEEDYQNFKRTALVSATAFATNSKVGCENEFAVFVETESDAYLPNLSEYVTFEKGEDKNIIDLEALTNILNDMSQQIKSVEIYYNPYTTELVNSNRKVAKHFNIITSKEV